MYSNILTYSYYEHHLVLINIVSTFSDGFLILCPEHRLSGPEYLDFFPMYLEQVATYVFAEMQAISHLCIHGFIKFERSNRWFLDRFI